MIEDIIELDNCNSETLRKSEKALLVLCDLFDRYSYPGEHPTKQEADKLSHETERILEYINIASDYVSEIKNDLKKIGADLDVLFDKVKKKADVSVNYSQSNYNNSASVRVDLVDMIIHMTDADEQFLLQMLIMSRNHIEKKVQS